MIPQGASPAAFGAAGTKGKAQFVATSEAAAAAHAADFHQESARDGEAEVEQPIKDGEDDGVDDEAAPDGVDGQQRRETLGSGAAGAEGEGAQTNIGDGSHRGGSRQIALGPQ